MKNKLSTIIVFITSIILTYICNMIIGYGVEEFYHCILMLILLNVIEINCKKDD